MTAPLDWLEYDPERRAQVQRALDVAGAGDVLLQTTINRIVTQLTNRELGALSTLDRRPGSGNASYQNRRSAASTGGGWKADTEEPAESEGAYTQASFTYRTLVGRGKITRKLMATGRAYGDVLAEEMSGKAEDFANSLESAIIQGDTNVTNSNEPNGLITLIQGTAGQIVAVTSAAAGDDFTLQQLDEAIDLVKGSGNRADLIIYASRLGRRKLNALLQAQQDFNDVVEVGAGFRVRSYDMIPIVTSTGIGDSYTWGGTKITDYTGGSTTAIIIVNKRYNWLEELTPTTVMPLARTSSQFSQFDIFWDGATVHKNTLGAAILGGIKNS